jgi:hypothetical protein
MFKTLLLIGQDRPVLAALAFAPGRLARADTIGDARRLLLRPDDDTAGQDYLIAYGPDIAVKFAGHDMPEAPLGQAWGRPVILVHGPHGDAMQLAARRLGAAGVVSLPAGWGWLCSALAGRAAKDGQR